MGAGFLAEEATEETGDGRRPSAERAQSESQGIGGGDGRLVAVELAGTAPSGRLAVVLPRGRRVEVSAGFDVATLERLLAVLEQV